MNPGLGALTAGLDPDALLSAVVREAAIDACLPPLRPDLGRSIHGYLRSRLRRERAADPESEAEGIFQDFLVRVLRRFRNRGADGIRGEGWFRAVARSALVGRLVKLAAEKRMRSEVAQALQGRRCLDDPRDLAARANKLIAKAMSRLPPRQRQVLELDGESLATAEIAAVMEIQPNSVGTLRYRAARALRRGILQDLG